MAKNKKKRPIFNWKKFDVKIVELALAKARKKLDYYVDIPVYSIGKKLMSGNDGALVFYFTDENIYFYCILIRRMQGIKELFVRAHEWGHLVHFSGLSKEKIKCLGKCFKEPLDRKYTYLRFEYEKRAFKEAYKLMIEAKVPLRIRDLFVEYSTFNLSSVVKNELKIK
jgi:hypothetical protein